MAVKIDVTQVLVNFDGENLQGQNAPLTLRTVLVNVLTNTTQGEQLSGKEQYERYAQARRIHDREEIEFTTAEAAMLQERVAQFYAPLVTGQVWEILEGGPDDAD
jgi:hypothetical protein